MGQVIYDIGDEVRDIKDEGVAKGVRLEFVEREGKSGSAFADLVIAADGASSTVRGILEPWSKRTYAGYAAWRWKIAESEVSEECLKALEKGICVVESESNPCVSTDTLTLYSRFLATLRL